MRMQLRVFRLVLTGVLGTLAAVVAAAGCEEPAKQPPPRQERQGSQLTEPNPMREGGGLAVGESRTITRSGGGVVPPPEAAAEASGEAAGGGLSGSNLLAGNLRRIEDQDPPAGAEASARPVDRRKP